MRNRVKQVMSRIFEVPVDVITDEATIDVVPGWDSLHHLELMLELEMEFDVTIPTMTMLELFTLQSIEEYLQGKVAVGPD